MPLANRTRAGRRDCGGGAPFCSALRAARGAVRNAKQKKAVPAKHSEANFWRPRFTWPLRAGKRANANFACSEGFFCPARRAIRQAGRSCAAGRCYADFCAHCLFACSALFMRALSLVSCLFLPNFFLSNFFSFVAQAATGLLFLSPLCGVVFRPACSLPSLRRLPPLWRLLCQVSVCLPCGFVCAFFVCLLPFSA